MWKKIAAMLCWSLLLSALPWALLAQDFGPIFDNLSRLDGIMTSLRESNNEQQRDNELLQTTIANLQNLLQTQGQLLNDQANDYAETVRISQKQAALLQTYISRSRRLTVTVIIAVPAAGLLGWIAGRVIR